MRRGTPANPPVGEREDAPVSRARHRDVRTLGSNDASMEWRALVGAPIGHREDPAVAPEEHHAHLVDLHPGRLPGHELLRSDRWGPCFRILPALPPSSSVATIRRPFGDA